MELTMRAAIQMVIPMVHGALWVTIGNTATFHSVVSTTPDIAEDGLYLAYIVTFHL